MIVGLGGYAGSGKDAFADAMVQHDSRWHKTYMSYSLELALLALDPYVREPPKANIDELSGWIRYSALHQQVGYNDSKQNPEVRRLLQKLGTEVGRNMFGENVWVDKMMEIATHYDFVIVTGIRYKNEIKAIRDSGGVTAWVERPGVGPINSHTSDNTLSPEAFEQDIVNSGTLDDLARIAQKFSNHLTTQGA